MLGMFTQKRKKQKEKSKFWPTKQPSWGNTEVIKNLIELHDM